MIFFWKVAAIAGCVSPQLPSPSDTEMANHLTTVITDFVVVFDLLFNFHVTHICQCNLFSRYKSYLSDFILIQLADGEMETWHDDVRFFKVFAKTGEANHSYYLGGSFVFPFYKCSHDASELIPC